MSLENGGLFDIKNNWRPPHKSHRKGINGDIEFYGMTDDGQCSKRFTETQRNILHVIIALVTRDVLLTEDGHFHTKQGR